MRQLGLNFFFVYYFGEELGMKSSGIGGQAVIEGIMMRNQNEYAIAVRKPDNEIEVKKEKVNKSDKVKKTRQIPFLRGVFSFVDSMVLGMSTIAFSASFFEDEGPSAEPDRFTLFMKKVFKDKAETVVMGCTIAMSIILAIALFMVLPVFVSNFAKGLMKNDMLLIVFEGVFRVLLFVCYVVAISFLSDIKRVYMYHGAEHKCINCIEHGKVLTVENVQKSSRLHKRCGTSFLLIVMVIMLVVNIIVSTIYPITNLALRVLSRVVLVPIVAGISYEFLRLAGNSDNIIIRFLSKPGMALQKLTTKEPDDSMVEVAIVAVEAVFDWKEYLTENFDVHFEESPKVSESEAMIKEIDVVKED